MGVRGKGWMWVEGEGVAIVEYAELQATERRKNLGEVVNSLRTA